ncbi:MAG: DUF3536 domain-containing protein [Deltaproteobacteria bacterium]|nr:DUF3536 domain-containing protein [Deltaproteobacteria bacterium]
MPSALVVHGHFYQPPRENPWTDEVEQEASAAPFHDWNARISAECYARNAFARMFDQKARVEHIANAYARMSFNFGPTLLRWIERNDRATYDRIIEGDRDSRVLQRGHGNAIAQAYNHMILPLASARDRVTQIRWGIADFVHRFGRQPEGMWLPETAVDRATLASLIDAGVAFTILSPHQAARVRPCGEAGAWRDVSDGSIDPTRAYRWLHPDGSGRSIALFFYDGPIAADVSFGSALSSSQTFIDRFLAAHQRTRDHVELLHVASDGETYGHHKQFGDLTLAHALEVEAARRGLRVTNYGAYLEESPPRWDAELRAGPDGEGTAWSCAHGVGRWVRDCGCHVGARAGWNQRWRTPLRTALDRVRDAALPHFESCGLFADAWAARDAYVELVLDRSRDGTARFLDAHRVPAGDQDRVRALQLLEMQRHAMLMYTSCGWFFDDIAGLEAVQVMKYAARVIDLCEQTGVPSPREALLDALAQARSNVAAKGSGADVYRTEVEPLCVTPERVACQFAFTSLVKDTAERGELAGWAYQAFEMRRAHHEPFSLVTGTVALENGVTGDRRDLEFAAIHLGSVDFYAGIRRVGQERLSRSADAIFSEFQRAPLPRILRALDDFGEVEFGLEHVLPDARQELLDVVFQDVVDRFAEAYARLHDENARTFDILRQAGYRLPPLVRAAGELTLASRFEREIERLRGVCDPDEYGEARAIAAEIALLGYRIDSRRTAGFLEESVEEQVRLLIAAASGDGLRKAGALVRIARDLGLELDLTRAQNLVYPLVAALAKDPVSRAWLGELGFAPTVGDGDGKANGSRAGNGNG